MGKVNLTKGDFNDILKNYDIGEYIKHKYYFTGDNTVYGVNTTKGKFILKIYGKASLKFVKYQIKLMEFLKKTKVATPKIIDMKKGGGLLIWKNMKIAIQEFAPGTDQEFANEKLAKDMGKKWGVLTKTLEKFKDRIETGYPREHVFNLLTWSRHNLFGKDMETESKILLDNIKKLDKSKLKKNLIHGDLCEGNFLVRGDEVSAIIDWDDAHEDYRVYDPAVSIAHNFVTQKKANKELIRIFIREYQKYVKLNSEEKKALYYFVKHNALNSTTWCYDQIKKHPSQKKMLLRWTKISMNKYFSFNKISLKEWLKLVG